MARNTAPYLLLILMLAAGTGKGQETGMDTDPYLVRLKGRIISAGDSQPIPYVNISYPRYRKGTSTNSSGYFTIEMLNIDTLHLSAMGFMPGKAAIPRQYMEGTTLVLVMKPVVYPLKEVRVTADRQEVNMEGIPAGKSSPIPQELRGDAFNENPSVFESLFNPLSFLQFYLSSREKEKRRVREAILLERQWEMHSQNYNKPMVMMLTGLSEAEADSFMVWFNALSVLPYTSSEYEVRAAIRSYFEIYKKEVKSN